MPRFHDKDIDNTKSKSCKKLHYALQRTVSMELKDSTEEKRLTIFLSARYKLVKRKASALLCPQLEVA